VGKRCFLTTSGGMRLLPGAIICGFWKEGEIKADSVRSLADYYPSLASYEHDTHATATTHS